MSPLAVEQALVRLGKAERAAAALRAATVHADMESAWSDFLIAAAAIYTKLEVGSRTNGKSTAWFGRKTKERRDDPLLRYIHHARNSDEHGIEAIAVKWDEHTGAGPEGPAATLELPAGGKITISRLDDHGQWIPVLTKKTETLRLMAVVDTRFGDTFPPPETHLGEPLPQPLYPSVVADLALAYLSRLIDEARAMLPSA